MNGAELKPLPEKIIKIHEEYHRDGITGADCISCSSTCCSRGGLALLENVVLIFEKYKKDLLRRTDFSFVPGLTFKKFIIKYFDIYCFQTGNIFRRKNLLLFHTKVVTKENRLVSIPAVPGRYTGNRLEEESKPEKAARGCVFLSNKSPDWPEQDGDTSRHCLLHSYHFNTHITEKPIDCVFFTCTSPLQAKAPAKRIAEQWISALANAFPESMERFRDIVGEFVIENESEKRPIYPGRQSFKGYHRLNG